MRAEEESSEVGPEEAPGRGLSLKVRTQRSSGRGCDYEGHGSGRRGREKCGECESFVFRVEWSMCVVFVVEEDPGSVRLRRVGAVVGPSVFPTSGVGVP